MVLFLVFALVGAAPARGLPVSVEAAPGAAYLAKCHIRTFKNAEGLFANTYVIDTKGPFHDTIPSPNAQCVFGKVKGQGPVTLHIRKAGDHAATSTAAGRWVRLDVW